MKKTMRRANTIFLVILMLLTYSISAANVFATTDYTITAEQKNEIYDKAMSTFGCGYIEGQAGPKVFDNAGLTFYALKNSGVSWAIGSYMDAITQESNLQLGNYFVEYISTETTEEGNLTAKFPVSKGDVLVWYNESVYEKSINSETADYSGYAPVYLAICIGSTKVDNGYEIQYAAIFKDDIMSRNYTLTSRNEKNTCKSVGVYHINNNGAFKIIKTSPDGNPLEGVTYKITMADGSTETKTTDENGIVELENIPSGTYKYQEIETVKGYAVDDTIYSTFVYNGDTLESHTITLKASLSVVNPSTGPTTPGGTTNLTDKPTTKDNGTKTPATGDTSNMGLWITLLVLAAGTGAVAYRKKTDR